MSQKSIVSAMENYKELLTALYKEHAPEKIDQIDFYLDRYKGKEKQFYITQKAKYANKKSVTDSKKILEEAMARIKKKNDQANIKTPPPIPPQKSEPPKKAGQKPVEAKKEEVKFAPKMESKKEEQKPEEPKEKISEKKEIKTVETKAEPAKEVTIEKKPTDKPKQEAAKVEINPSIKKKEPAKPIEQKTKIKEEKPADRKIDPVIKEEKSSEKDIIIPPPPPKEEKLKPKKDSWEEEKRKFQQTKRTYQKKEKKRSPVIWYFGGAALIILVIAFVVWFFHFKDMDKNHKTPINVQKVKVENKPVSTAENTSNGNSEAKDNKQKEKEIIKKETPSQKESNTSAKNQAKAVQKQEKKTTTAKTRTQKKQSQTRPTADRIYAKDINKPAIFVSCFATKTERQAQQKIKLLKKHGLDAHYYWIPDLDSKGNSFFKIVAGPFKSVKDAYPSLTKAQERVNFDSYILTIK